MQASLYTCTCYKIDDFIEGVRTFQEVGEEVRAQVRPFQPGPRSPRPAEH